MSDDNASQTPLVDLLRGVPKDAVNNYCYSTTHSQHIPVGRLCNEAAEHIASLEAKVRELEAELPDDYTESKDWAFDNSPVERVRWLKSRIKMLKEEREEVYSQLSASRQQVERLVEALQAIAMTAKNQGPFTGASFDQIAQEVLAALAAVEKERKHGAA